MMFFEVVGRGATPSGLHIQTWWYRVDAGDIPTEADLETVANVWQARAQSRYLGAQISAVYTLNELHVYGYDNLWGRRPYLPFIKAVNSGGTWAATEVLEWASVIYSAKVRPIQNSMKRDENNAVYESPVVRGYWSHGPVSATWHDTAGNLTPASYQNLANVEAYRAMLAEPLVDAAFWPHTMQPIRVGVPGRDLVQRGYGDVVDVVIRPLITSRRSRRKGHGA